MTTSAMCGIIVYTTRQATSLLHAVNEGRTSDIAGDFAEARMVSGGLQSALTLHDLKKGKLSAESLLNSPRRYGAKQAALTALIRIGVNLWRHREDFEKMFCEE